MYLEKFHSEIPLNKLIKTVQQNCHISDACYAGNYTLCIYLLKMREFYRWEKALPYTTKLSNDDIGPWLTERESLWDEAEKQDYKALSFEDMQYDPYDQQQLNNVLEQKGLIYSGGYGAYGKPVFFIAELEEKTVFDDYTLYVAGHELAREVSAPPGMAGDKNIFIRKESLRRFIWEKFEESHWHKQENPLARALGCYDFQGSPEKSLDRMTNVETDTVLHHEIGEIMATRLLGDDWDEMVINMPRSQLEFMARAIKDHLADAVSTLPRLIENNEAAQLHFYFANMSGMRKVLFPSIHEAYKKWLESNSFDLLRNMIDQSREHWLTLARQSQQIFNQQGIEGYEQIENLIKSRYL